MSETPLAVLPGGLWEGGCLRTEFAFKPIDGAFELAIADAVAGAGSMPAAVTTGLAASLRSLAGGVPSAERVDALCVADRQFLVRALRLHMESGDDWIHAACGACGERFDVHVRIGDLPVVAAGRGFPFADVTVHGRRFRARVPTGEDQQWLTHQSGERLEERLAARLLVAVNDAPATLDGSQIDRPLIDALDQALDAVTPALVAQLVAQCPQCDTSIRVEVEPYAALDRCVDDVLVDVHRIAAFYHWAETDILHLPTARRRTYLGLIDRARGFAH